MTPGLSVPVSVLDSTPCTSGTSSLRVKRKALGDLRSEVDTFTDSTSGLATKQLDVRLERYKVASKKIDARMQATKFQHQERMAEMQIQLAQMTGALPMTQLPPLNFGALPGQLGPLNPTQFTATMAQAGTQAGAQGNAQGVNVTGAPTPPASEV